MRKLLYALVGVFLLATQVAEPAIATAPATAFAAELSTQANDKTNHSLRLNTKSYVAIDLTDNSPDFDSEVLVPLRARQAARAEEAAKAEEAARAARARKSIVRTTVAVKQFTGDAWEALRNCEAGGDYTKNTGNGYYGAYQYNLGTWANYMGYARPDLAPPAVQDAKARETQARRGWAPWPACARKLGLL